ncbi:uncharacterized protein [Ptychodera flava]|uniref:uncharacterized protein n=1 Tax=Ptychodera flava TaxID=63121 RepID=UPI00396A5BC4
MSICNEMLATCSSTLVHHEQKQEVKGEGLRDDPEDEFEPRCKVCNKPLVNNPRSVRNHVKAAHPHIGFKSMEQVVQRRLPCHRCGRRFILKCHLATHVRGCRYAEGKSSKNKIMFSDEFHAQPLSAPDRDTGTQENNKKKFKTSSVKSTTSTDRRHTARRKKGRKQWRRNKFPLLYTCKVCRQPFAYRGSFESHMRSRHPEEGKVVDISQKKEEKERSVGQDSKRKSTISNTKVGNIIDRVKEAKRDLQVCVLRKMSLVALHKKMPRCSVCRKTLADVSALITHRREVHNMVHTRKKRKCSPSMKKKETGASGRSQSLNARKCYTHRRVTISLHSILLTTSQQERLRNRRPSLMIRRSQN